MDQNSISTLAPESTPTSGSTADSVGQPEDSWTDLLWIRLIEGITYYPMLVQLTLTLIAIRVTESIGAVLWITLVTLTCLSLGYFLLLHRKEMGNRVFVWQCLLSMTCIACLYSWVHDSANHRIRSQLAQWHSMHAADRAANTAQATWKPVVLKGTIEQAVRYRKQEGYGSDQADSWQSQSLVHVHSVQRAANSWQPLSIKATLTIDDQIRGFFPGDEVQLYGSWRRPLEPTNPGQFDVRNRYAELGLAAQIKVDSASLIRKTSEGSPWRIDRGLAQWTEYSLDAMNRYVVFDQAPLTAALVLGQRDQADWDLQVEMLSTGTIHMMSISGMHIEMVAFALLFTGWLMRLPSWFVYSGTVSLCILYAMLCGANPPVARATIMLSCALLARFLGWSFTGLNILAFAALLLLAQRTSIAFEVGSQLSFLTVAVLILTFPILSRRAAPIERLIESKHTARQRFLRSAKHFVRESIRSSFWVSFLSAPLVWESFHILSPIGILLNLVLWLPMLIALLSGLGLVLLFWFPPLAWLCGLLCGTSLLILDSFVSIGHKVPYGHFWAPAPPTWWMIGFYAIALVITLWRGTHRPRARRELIWGLGTWFLFGCLLIQFQQALRPYKHAFGQASLAITFIDVGHGTSVLIEPPTGEIWLYDAGRMGDSKRSHQAIAQALWTMGIGHIDGLILSHADADHYNAMPGLIERFSIKRFISTNSVLNHSSPTLRDLLNTLNARGIPIETWSENTPDQDKFGCKWTVHHPGDAFPEKSAAGRLQNSRGVRDNATSLCISIQYAGRCILLPGDLEEPGTSALISAPPLDLDVLMAPHHGSLTANPKPLIAWATPETIIISGSARSVATKVFETYSPEDQQVLHTARDHALRLTVDPKGTMHWYHWSQNHWQRITEADQVP